MIKPVAFSILFGSASAAIGGECAPNIDIDAKLNALYAELKDSGSEAQSKSLSAQLWDQWLKAPDSEAQGLLDQGMTRRNLGDLAGSRAVLTQLVKRCPDYAEGWNQRAFSRYLAQDYKAALKDLLVALSLRPRHLGAISGKALTHAALGNRDAARQEILRALRLNPFTPERHMFPDIWTEL